MIVNTPRGQDTFFDEKAIRRAAVLARIPTITTIAAAQAAVEGIAAMQKHQHDRLRAAECCMKIECGKGAGRRRPRYSRPGGRQYTGETWLYNKLMLTEGVIAAIPTPFYPDERVYLRKIEANMARYSRSPLAGMLVLGSTGEAVMLDDAECREALRVAAEATAPEKVLIAGVSRESVRSTLAMAEAAAEYGYDAVLVRTPIVFLAADELDGGSQLFPERGRPVAAASPALQLPQAGAVRDPRRAGCRVGASPEDHRN